MPISPVLLLENRTHRILKLIESRPGGIDRKAMVRATKSIPSEERLDILDSLICDGLAYCQVLPTAGRPKSLYFPTFKIQREQAAKRRELEIARKRLRDRWAANR